MKSFWPVEFRTSIAERPSKGPNVQSSCLAHTTSAYETPPTFHPEFGRFMLEATPGKPWSIGFRDLLDVEPNMKLRLVTSPTFWLHG